MNLTDKTHMDLYKCLTEKGSITLLDYIFLEKLYRNFSYDYYGQKNPFLFARYYKSSCDEGTYYFYECPAFFWFYENPIYSCFYNVSDMIARLKYYKSLGIIDLEEAGKSFYIRFSNKATELFEKYLDSIN